MDGKASILYQLPGHFAATLESIALTGKPGFSLLHIDSNIDFTKMSSDNVEIIKNDNDLRPQFQFSTDELKSIDDLKQLIKKLDNK